MSINLSRDITPPSLALQNCLVDGLINLPRYYYYQRSQNNYLQHLKSDETCRRTKMKRQSSEVPFVMKRQTVRSVKKHLVQVRDKDVNLIYLTPEDILWYLLYVANPPQSEILLKLFRLRFCMPHSSFIKLGSDISVHPIEGEGNDFFLAHLEYNIII